MNLPTESQWARYSALCARLTALPTLERGATLQALRATGTEDPQVLSLLAVHCALPPDPTRDRSGERLGNCTLEERLGAGGMGVVYRAQQHLGPVTRPVAVKLIHPVLLRMAREEALARFLAELQTLVTLQHEHIARIYDGGIYEDPHTHEQLPYIAMELVHGGLPITTYARDYALSWQERLAVFVRVCHAVRYAHEHRVVHRDLKPANILVDHDGRPVVIDFGLAHACDALLPGAHIAASGTPAYMSPEQVSDTLGAVSDKSDVYALGLILYELLTEQPPYALPRNGLVEEWRQVIMEATPPPLRQYNAAYGGELEAIVAAALAKQPTHRIPVAVLRSRLERHLQTLPRERDRSLHDTSQVQRDIQTVPIQGDHGITPVDVRPWAESGGSSATAPETRRLTGQHDLDRAGTGSPPPPAQSAPQSALPSMPGTASGSGAARPDRPDPERRQLTVMFCDLVGSTALSGQLDPEDLREVLRAYLETCAEVIARFGGNIEKFLGDGALVCFGYPQAHDDDPQRAVRAGLMIVESIARLNTRLAQNWGVQLEVRLGIHTGLVVAGDLGVRETREPQAIVGEAPNVAARLQEVAAPNTVVISAATARLVDGYFTLDALGPQVLKGVAMPVPVYRVVGESTAQTRLDVAATRGLTPFVGREHEVALLLERWASVKDSRGQVILLSGEAGIGKSLLAQAFREHLAGETYTRIVYNCSPYYQQSAFYPVVEHIQRLLQFRKDDTPEEKLHKLEAALGPYDFALEEMVPLLAALLSLPLPERYPPLTLTPQRQKQKTLEALLAWLLKEAERQPVCVVMEDLHWADPSTLELLSLLIDQAPLVRLLILLIFRPDFRPPWAIRSHLTHLTLSRLPRHQVETMVERITAGKALPGEVLQQLVTKTDGVPLFVEESTKMVLESGLVKEWEGRYVLTGPLPPLAIPATLHDSLMARLDRLETAKAVAQLGATIGREFAYEVIRLVSPVEETTLQQGLAQLVEAELLYQRGLAPQARYLFKHALIQDTAYASLLRSTRRQYHRQIAQVLEDRSPETQETQPELVAHHYTEAGLHAQALPYWQQAGQHAIERSANVEAISHLTKGLEILKTLPDTPERTRHELTLHLTLAAPLAMVKGHAAPEVEHAYTRAYALSQQAADSQQRFVALLGLMHHYQTSGQLRTKRALCEESLTLAEEVQDLALLETVHEELGSVLFFMGEPALALGHLEQCITPHCRWVTFDTGFESAVLSLSRTAWALWMLGYPDRALGRVREALALAEELSRPHSLVIALQYTALLHQARREPSLAQEQAEAVMTLSSEHGFTYWLEGGRHVRGWALAEQGRCTEGIVELHQGLAAWHTMGAVLGQTHILARLAEAYQRCGRAREGLRVLDEALAAVHEREERHYEAEIYRLKGELLLQSGAQGPTANVERMALDVCPRVRETEACLQEAFQVARRQQAKSLELRAAMSLSRLWRSQGKHAAAHQLLAEIFAWFTEGFETLDLLEAKALLEARA